MSRGNWTFPCGLLQINTQCCPSEMSIPGYLVAASPDTWKPSGTLELVSDDQMVPLGAPLFPWKVLQPQQQRKEPCHRSQDPHRGQFVQLLFASFNLPEI